MQTTIKKIAEKTNVFTYAAANERIFERIQANFGKKRETTFFSDLSIAEWYGLSGVKETYENVMKSWIDDVKYITEFALSLAWKAYQHEDADNVEMCKEYWTLFEECKDTIYKHYDGNADAVRYIFETLD